jgi:hypothetical protein
MLTSLGGGLVIGLAAAILLLGHGRIAGISGVVGGVLTGPAGAQSAGLLFLAGLVGGGVLFARLVPSAFPTHAAGSTWRYIVAGLFVGFGTRLGGGCTSGHGVCGLGRSSLRSLVAVATFMTTGAIAVFVVRHLAGGQ